MIQASAYLRVSTDGQLGKNAFGLADQAATVEQFARENEMDLVGRFVDEGISGTTLNRPGLLDAIAGAKRGEFQVLLIAKIDRLGRDLMQQLWLEKEFLRFGVEVVSVSEPFRGQDPATRLYRQIVGAFAEFERHRITDRLSGGRRAKARAGGYAGGRPPFGYKVVQGEKTLQVDESKAATVRRIFELRQQWPRWTLQEIADRATVEGHRTSRRAVFTPTTIRRILVREEFYRGVYCYGEITAPGGHEPIL